VDKLVLIDGNAILHRAYHALPPLTTRKGEPINAVYGFVTMLLRVISDLEPVYLVVAFDEKGPTFRNEMDEDYQAHRPEADEELVGQFGKAREVVGAFGIPFFSIEGYEADDVIGTIVKRVENEIVIVTGDKDIMQLVNKRVKLYMPRRGLSGTALVGVDEVKEKVGVEPGQIVDYKALVGDPSDNYKGVAGIGPKTATMLLKKYMTFERIYESLEEISPSVRNRLVEGRGSGELSRKLARIMTDVPIEFNIEDAGKWRVDCPEIVALFEEWGFGTLLSRIRKLGKRIRDRGQMSLV